MMRLVVPCLCLLLLSAPPARGGDRREILSFGKALAADGDHYRAITEYKRFLHLFPEDPDTATVYLAIAESYVAGRRWDDAEKTLDHLIDDFHDGPEERRARFLLADIALRRGNQPIARQRFRDLLETSSDPDEQRQLRYRLAWSYVVSDRYREAGDVLVPLTDATSNEFKESLDHLSEQPLKSPALAGGLSALLPGTGQLYAGRPRDAALAFLLNAAFLWGAIDAFDSGNEATGAILLFFEVGWYTGNIFNAVSSTHKYNRDLRLKAREPLRERFEMQISRQGLVPFVGIAGRF